MAAVAELIFSYTQIIAFNVVINDQPTPFYAPGGPLLQNFAITGANDNGLGVLGLIGVRHRVRPRTPYESGSVAH